MNGLRHGDRLTVIVEGVAYRATYRRPHPASPTDTFYATYFGDDAHVHHRAEFLRNEGVTWCRGRDKTDVMAMLAALALDDTL